MRISTQHGTSPAQYGAWIQRFISLEGGFNGTADTALLLTVRDALALPLPQLHLALLLQLALLQPIRRLLRCSQVPVQRRPPAIFSDRALLG